MYDMLDEAEAGTAKPHAPRRAIAHVLRSNVDLPAMFGPVRRKMPYRIIY
jgi:hypothetical protein